jgi:hypothetical protein
MFKPKVLKFFSIVAIVICVTATLISLVIAVMEGGMIYLSALSWAVLGYASYCAMKLTGYDIYEEDMRKIGWSVYLLFVVFVLFLFVGAFIGPVVAIIVASRLHFQKTTNEKWVKQYDSTD